jgi:hypothetical protein
MLVLVAWLMYWLLLGEEQEQVMLQIMLVVVVVLEEYCKVLISFLQHHIL